VSNKRDKITKTAFLCISKEDLKPMKLRVIKHIKTLNAINVNLEIYKIKERERERERNKIYL
jgi:hypothetical protein